MTEETVSFLAGGYLKEIPKPHKRKFPGRKKRTVQVSIGRFWGVGQHYFASLTEEDNPIWCTHRDEYTDQDHWHKAWDDEDAKGRTFRSPHFNSPLEAYEWVREMVAENFPSKTHKVRDPDVYGRKPRWFYREGD